MKAIINIKWKSLEVPLCSHSSLRRPRPSFPDPEARTTCGSTANKLTLCSSTSQTISTLKWRCLKASKMPKTRTKKTRRSLLWWKSKSKPDCKSQSCTRRTRRPSSRLTIRLSLLRRTWLKAIWVICLLRVSRMASRWVSRTFQRTSIRLRKTSSRLPIWSWISLIPTHNSTKTRNLPRTKKLWE